ncbi:MAG TPA: phospholipase [Thermoanaerobaculia bacterium]|nr:phospholipase [Thermoanaerobaculia bacterium]
MFLAIAAVSGCAGVETASTPAMKGRLQARPGNVHTSPRPSAPWLYVPKTVKEPAPLLIALHGAGGRGARTLEYTRGSADGIGAIVIAPDSLGRTWDVIASDLGPDVARIDAQLAAVFGAFAIDVGRIAVSGFSDGASYALTLGIANGDLFSHAIAYSPGFLAAPAATGSPRIFISHGTRDGILPIDRCSRRLAPGLKRAGYDVEYVEFDGGHTVPAGIARAAMEWFTE